MCCERGEGGERVNQPGISHDPITLHNTRPVSQLIFSCWLGAFCMVGGWGASLMEQSLSRISSNNFCPVNVRPNIYLNYLLPTTLLFNILFRLTLDLTDLELVTWSATGRDSGTGCSVGVLIVWEMADILSITSFHDIRSVVCLGLIIVVRPSVQSLQLQLIVLQSLSHI